MNSIYVSGETGSAKISVDPNPFSPDGDGFQDRTAVSYRVPAKSLVTLRVYDVKGRKVRTLLDEEPGADGEVYWTGDDDSGKPLSLGIYILHMTASGESIEEAVTTVVIAGRMN